MLSYLYYRFFRFFEFIETHLTPEGIRIPEYLAMFALAFLAIFNLIAIDVIIYRFYGIHLILSSLLVTSFFVCVIVLSIYLLFLRKRRYISIIDKYKTESNHMKNLSIVSSIIYVLLSVILLIIVT